MALGTWYGYGRATGNSGTLWAAAFAQYNATAYGGPAGATLQPGLRDARYSLFRRDKVSDHYVCGACIFGCDLLRTLALYGVQRYLGAVDGNGAPVFWSRDNAWAAAGFAQALRQLPQDNPHALEYAAKLRAMAAALAAIQVRWRLHRAGLLCIIQYVASSSDCFL